MIREMFDAIGYMLLSMGAIYQFIHAISTGQRLQQLGFDVHAFKVLNNASLFMNLRDN